MEMNRWEHIAGKGSVVKMAHTKRMHSGTCEKETDQWRQTRENIWPQDRLEKIYGRTPMEMYPVETYDG
ncbi:hypothetical protein M513_02325 [Trichuris suis]|uniref:Uncharacterized protein n=1 Tax=Trichuris suis TaxID=68888 RepID=A0A085MHF3_9BILA|nr:hypothetical protein M513_02325 [Trichuris suis]